MAETKEESEAMEWEPGVLAARGREILGAMGISLRNTDGTIKNVVEVIGELAVHWDSILPEPSDWKGWRCCPRCQAMVYAEDNFCSNCGYEMRGIQE